MLSQESCQYLKICQDTIVAMKSLYSVTSRLFSLNRKAMPNPYTWSYPNSLNIQQQNDESQGLFKRAHDPGLILFKGELQPQVQMNHRLMLGTKDQWHNQGIFELLLPFWACLYKQTLPPTLSWSQGLLACCCHYVRPEAASHWQAAHSPSLSSVHIFIHGRHNMSSVISHSWAIGTLFDSEVPYIPCMVSK